MLLLTSTSDKLQVITGSAGTVRVHASYVDADATGVKLPPGGRTNTAGIVSATTTDVVASPASGERRNVKHISIRNDDASVSNAITVQHTDGTTVTPLWKGTLLPGELVVLDNEGDWQVYTSAGTIKSSGNFTIYNQSVAAQGAGFATDTYLTGSFCLFPVAPKVGTRYRLIFDVSKTAAGTATPILTVRVGTAGSTADTARLTFTFAAGTAAASVARFMVEVHFRTVGSGTSAVLVGTATCINTGTTGVIGAASGVLQVTSAGFDSTVASLGIGVSVNGGTSAAWTVQNVESELVNTL